jgi:hypothetical protein
VDAVSRGVGHADVRAALVNDPRAVVTTTPEPIKIIRELIADPTTVITRGSTLSGLGHQPRVLHRYHRLRRETLQQRNLLIGEGANFLAFLRRSEFLIFGPPQIWLPFLDTYRTMCLAPQPEFRRLLEQARELPIAA